MLFITSVSAMLQALPPPQLPAGTVAPGLPVCVPGLKNKGCATPPVVLADGAWRGMRTG